MGRGDRFEGKRPFLTLRRQPRASFALTPEGIDAFSAWLEAQIGALRLDRRGTLRVRLLAEELLLRFADRFDEALSFDASLRASFGRPQLRLELAGEPFNPLSVPEDEDRWYGMLRAAVAVDPRYSYVSDRNVLRIPLPSGRRNPALRLLVAVLIGCALGLLGKYLPVHEGLAGFGERVFPVVYDLWIGVLGAMSGPVIFLMVITTILNTSQLTRQGGSRVYVVGRYFLLSFLASGATVLILGSWMRRIDGAGPASGLLWEGVSDLLKGLIPTNIVDPFVSAHTPQLLLMAFVLGGAMVALGERGKALRDTTRQINTVGLRLCGWLSEAVPPFTAVFLMLEIWTGRTVSLPQLWKPFAVATALTLGMLALSLLGYALRLRVKPSVLLRAVVRPVAAYLRSGRQEDVLEDMGKTLALLGVDAKYARLSLPQGVVLYMPVSSVGVLVYALYACAVWDVETDFVHLAAAVFLAVLLFVATPPVPGANLLAYTALFSWLGVPSDALIDAMVFDVLFGILAGAGNLFMLQLETLVSAKRIGLLDEKALRS